MYLWLGMDILPILLRVCVQEGCADIVPIDNSRLLLCLVYDWWNHLWCFNNGLRIVSLKGTVVDISVWRAGIV